MLIDKIEAVAIRVPLKKDFGGSVYNVTSRCTVITRLWVKDGPVAEIYNGDNRSHGPEIAALVNDTLAPLLLGRDVRDWQSIHALLESKVPAVAMAPELMMQAIACVDSAVWDAMGKCYEVSVARLMGGFRNELAIISIGGYYLEGKTLADLGREMQDLRARGMAGCKVKVGGLSPEEDAERVAAARDGAGPDFLISVDANRGWKWRDAARFAHLVAPLDIVWFEEPCHWMDDLRNMAQVRQASSIPVNAGQSEITGQAVRRLIDADAVDFVNFDASEAGGITVWQRVAGMTQLSDILLTHHEEPQIAAHMLAAQPHGYCVECFADPERDPFWDHMLLNRPVVANGTIKIADTPGFGITIDPAMIEKYKI